MLTGLLESPKLSASKARSNFLYSKGFEHGEQIPLNSSWFAIAVSDYEGNVCISYDSVGPFEEYFLTEGAGSGGELSDARLDFYGLSQKSWPSVIDVDVDYKKGCAFSLPFLEVDVFLKKGPAGFLQEF
jgi:hypothetical protein